jgi:fumarate reductase (CoM/CoB) subunit A
MNIHETDVLVIGGGAAGMWAALAARQEGCRVLLVSKTPLGISTCTYLSGGMFSVPTESNPPERHRERTLQTGKGINDPKLVQILSEEAADRVRELERLGIPGKWEKEGFYCLGKPPAWGAPLALGLAQACKHQGVLNLPWVVINRLGLEGGEVSGALAWDYREGKPMAFEAKATILATGGGGALYERHDNPLQMTGDGYVLAFHAGCRLRDMEFVQFLPPGLAEPGKPSMVIAPTLCDYGKVVNSLGEDIPEKYRLTARPLAVRSRDAFSLAIFQEEQNGREVFLDLRSLTEDRWPRDNMAQTQRGILTRQLRCQERPIRISPVCHHFMGGVAIDRDGRTEVPGLFAAGEVAGGVHGANRMGGNALSETAVFGYRAGKAAALKAKEEKRKGPSAAIHQGLKEFEKSLLLQEGEISFLEMKVALGKILWEKAGILRNGPGLKKALEEIYQLREERLPKLQVQNPREVLGRMEIENGLWVGEMIVRCALFREESRGAHFREDFPKSDDSKWKGNLFLQKSPEGMRLEFRPLD